MKNAIVQFGPAILSGILLSLAFPVYNLSPIAWVALVPLLLRTAGMPLRQVALHFAIAGWVFHTLLLQWLVSNVMWAGGWALWGQQLLCLYLAFFWAVCGVAWAWLRGRSSMVGGAAALAVLWVAMEALLDRLFSGFGWSSLAYSQGRDLPFLQWAAIGSGLLVSFYLVWANGLLALAITDSRYRVQRVVGLVVLVAATHGVGLLLLEEPQLGDDPVRVGIFQSNYSLEMKWDGEYHVDMIRNAALKSRALDAQSPVDIMIWPEALILENIRHPEVDQILKTLAVDTEAMLYSGAARYDTMGKPYNSSYLIDAQGQVVGTYDKVHLAPFGEYVPLSNILPFITAVVPSIGNLETGTEQKIFEVDGRKMGPMICFEVLFARMSEQLYRDGADFLTVITNLAWFGHSNALAQELEIARVRAVETRLPLVHAANTGISGVFDPYGRFEHSNAFVSKEGNVFSIRDDIGPNATIMERVAGTYALPEPGTRPIPQLPAIFPWLMMALAPALLVAGLVIGGGSRPGTED